MTPAGKKSGREDDGKSGAPPAGKEQDGAQAFKLTAAYFNSIKDAVGPAPGEGPEGKPQNDNDLSVKKIGRQYFRVWDHEDADRLLPCVYSTKDKEKLYPHLILEPFY